MNPTQAKTAMQSDMPSSATSPREQLSALMDGALDRDATRFLLKRCESDAELGECWQRWHVAGEILRGGKVVPVKIDLVRAVSLALEQEAKPAQGAGRTVLRWGGGFAVAASVALAALIVVRPAASPEAPLVANLPSPAATLSTGTVATVASATVAPSSLREQDLRPPYRLDAQTVADEGGRSVYGAVRFDPRIERYLQAQLEAARAQHTLRVHARAPVAQEREAVRELDTVE